MATQFDQYAGSYKAIVEQAIGFCGKGIDFFTALKAEHLLRMAARFLGPLQELEVLDVGCGVGQTDRFLRPHVKELCGVDVSTEAIQLAQAHNPDVRYLAYDGSNLPFSDNTYDLAFAMCVMHHVRPEEWSDLLGEMKRVVRPGGIVAVYEHNPLNLLTRLAVARCEFDRDAVLISRRMMRQLMGAIQLDVVGSPCILFFPITGRLVRLLESYLGWLPMGAQYAALARKPA
jgi:SAM-dependent methyltransferase